MRANYPQWLIQNYSVEEITGFEAQADSMRDQIIAQFMGLGIEHSDRRCKVTVAGIYVWVESELLASRPDLRGVLKSNGFRFCQKHDGTKAWSYSPIRYKGRYSKQSLDQIATKYNASIATW